MLASNKRPFPQMCFWKATPMSIRWVESWPPTLWNAPSLMCKILLDKFFIGLKKCACSMSSFTLPIILLCRRPTTISRGQTRSHSCCRQSEMHLPQRRYVLRHICGKACLVPCARVRGKATNHLNLSFSLSHGQALMFCLPLLHGQMFQTCWPVRNKYSLWPWCQLNLCHIKWHFRNAVGLSFTTWHEGLLWVRVLAFGSFCQTPPAAWSLVHPLLFLHLEADIFSVLKREQTERLLGTGRVTLPF